MVALHGGKRSCVQVAGKVDRRGTDLVLPKALQLKLLTVDLLRPPK